jgi:nicotinamide-nucleotide amidase
MWIEIINTGNELLLGDTVNTHASWLGQQIAEFQHMVQRTTVVPDGKAIKGVLSDALVRADVVLVTGGLGPTNDDVTRELTAELLGLPLIKRPEAYQHLQNYFSMRKRGVDDASMRLAYAPEGAEILLNDFGTACGIYLCHSNHNGKEVHLFLLPGPPRELRPMFLTKVKTRLQKIFGVGEEMETLYMTVTGIGESEIVAAVEKNLEQLDGLTLGYCLGAGDVDVRLSGRREVVKAARELVLEKLGSYVFSESKETLEQSLVRMMIDKKLKLTTAESCTGGFLASRITDVSGSSQVFEQGWVTYANHAKQSLLEVSEDLLKTVGAVSAEVAEAMARGALRQSGADFALALTGIAGPTGGTDQKPQGLVYIALASKKRVVVCKKVFPGARDRFKLMASQTAMDMLRRLLLGYSIE